MFPSTQLVVLTETYCNKVNIQITQRDDVIQKYFVSFNISDIIELPRMTPAHSAKLLNFNVNYSFLGNSPASEF